MKRSAAIGAVLLFLLTSGAIAFAETKYYYREGTCPTGETWWSVTRYEDGNPVFIEGRNCKGERYYRHIGRVVSTSNPIAGVTPTHGSSCNDSSIISVWSSVINYTADYEPAWMGGQSCDGNYWVATEFTDAGGDPGGNGE